MNLESNGLDGYVGGLRDAGLGNTPMPGVFGTTAAIPGVGHLAAYNAQLEQEMRNREARNIRQQALRDEGMRGHYAALEARRAYNLESQYGERDRELRYQAALLEQDAIRHNRDRNKLLLEEAKAKRDDMLRSRKTRDEFMTTALFVAFEDIYADGDGRASKESVKAISDALGKEITDISLDEYGQIQAYGKDKKPMNLTSNFYAPLMRYAQAKQETDGEGIAQLVSMSLPEYHRELLKEDLDKSRIIHDIDHKAYLREQEARKLDREHGLQMIKEAHELRDRATNLRKAIEEGYESSDRLKEADRLDEQAGYMERIGYKQSYNLDVPETGWDREVIRLNDLGKTGLQDATDSAPAPIYN